MSSTNNKKGVTLEEKAVTLNEYSMEAYEGFDPNDYHVISPEIKAEIVGKKLKYKWINAHKLAANHGFDKKGWRPYKINQELLTKSGVYGSADVDGYLRRGDLVLAVMPEALHSKHRAIINQSNLANRAAMGSKQAAKQLRETLKDSQVKGVKVIEDDEE